MNSSKENHVSRAVQNVPPPSSSALKGQALKDEEVPQSDLLDGSINELRSMSSETSGPNPHRRGLLSLRDEKTSLSVGDAGNRPCSGSLKDHPAASTPAMESAVSFEGGELPYQPLKSTWPCSSSQGCSDFSSTSQHGLSIQDPSLRSSLGAGSCESSCGGSRGSFGNISPKHLGGSCTNVVIPLITTSGPGKDQETLPLRVDDGSRVIRQHSQPESNSCHNLSTEEMYPRTAHPHGSWAGLSTSAAEMTDPRTRQCCSCKRYTCCDHVHVRHHAHLNRGPMGSLHSGDNIASIAADSMKINGALRKFRQVVVDRAKNEMLLHPFLMSQSFSSNGTPRRSNKR